MLLSHWPLHGLILPLTTTEQESFTGSCDVFPLPSRLHSRALFQRWFCLSDLVFGYTLFCSCLCLQCFIDVIVWGCFSFYLFPFCFTYILRGLLNDLLHLTLAFTLLCLGQ